MVRQDRRIGAVFVTGPNKVGAATHLTLLDKLLFGNRSGGHLSRVTIPGIFAWAAEQRTALGKKVAHCIGDHHPAQPYPDALVQECLRAWITYETERNKRWEMCLISRAPLNVGQMVLLAQFPISTVIHIEPDQRLEAAFGTDKHWRAARSATTRVASRLDDSGLTLKLRRQDGLAQRLQLTLQHMQNQQWSSLVHEAIDNGLRRLTQPHDSIYKTIREIEGQAVTA